MAHVEPLPSGKYRVAWRVDGKKQSRTFEEERDARIFAESSEANPRREVFGDDVFPGGLVLSKAAIAQNQARERMQRRLGRPQSPTVAKFGADVIDDPQLAQNSRDMYAAALRKAAQDPLGDMPVGEVKEADVDAFFRRLQLNRANVRSTLTKVFRAAVRRGLITRSPMDGADVKIRRRAAKLRRGDPRILTAEQLEALARACRSERDALAVRLGGYVGLRAGEVGGLTVDDVDGDDCRIHVRRNAQRTSAGYQVGLPKTQTSERSLKVPCSLARELADYADRNAREDGVIFWTRNGNPMTDQTLTHIVVKATERAGLRRITFHDLRHTCASLLIAARMEPKAVQRYLGHSSIRMTFDVYAGLFPESDAPLAEAMEALRAAAERKALPAADVS